ncbi:hypothetical protein NDU88_002486 [Pleurodeles waltl]|uniref:Uncharacterized protein n=1 Tax=Pleurodeles waltl TaxID=8319 RepID=A0AAV7UXS0_PLEWA|nr:hypothetical protein NDU88_002486 [Pleurodeles waltl]
MGRGFDCSALSGAAAALVPPRLFLRTGGPLTLGRGWAHSRGLQMVPRPMPRWAPRPFKRIHYLPGPCVLRFWEAAWRLPTVHAASAADEIR